LCSKTQPPAALQTMPGGRQARRSLWPRTFTAQPQPRTLPPQPYALQTQAPTPRLKSHALQPPSHTLKQQARSLQPQSPNAPLQPHARACTQPNELRTLPPLPRRTARTYIPSVTTKEELLNGKSRVKLDDSKYHIP
jgi:hypothetical protein